MSSPIVNPYQAPQAPSGPPKLTAADAADIKRRDIAVFVLLCVVTLGIYWFYVSYHWSKEINGLVGRAKYNPVLVVVVNVLTCGLAGLVFESLFAFDLVEQTRLRNTPSRQDQLATWVLVCNCAAFVTAIIPFGFLLALPLGTLASVLVQVELNRLADNYGR
jgi:hypothetical protein